MHVVGGPRTGASGPLLAEVDTRSPRRSLLWLLAFCGVLPPLCTVLLVMAKSMQKQRRGARRPRTVRVPRAIQNGTVAVIRRVFNAGNVVKGAADAGNTWGTVPSNLSDWASLQALFGRYRLLKVVNHYMTSGEYDTTPAYPILWVYHDLASLGAPASLPDAFLKTGVRALTFTATRTKHSFPYIPMVWTSSGFQTQVPAPQLKYQTAAGFAPTFSSISAWAQNYNTAVGSANLLLLQEMVLEFSEPI